MHPVETKWIRPLTTASRVSMLVTCVVETQVTLDVLTGGWSNF